MFRNFYRFSFLHYGFSKSEKPQSPLSRLREKLMKLISNNKKQIDNFKDMFKKPSSNQNKIFTYALIYIVCAFALNSYKK
jgi:hypothetical protein